MADEELSEHISSRLEVEQILTDTPATVITLRAAVILGRGSTSFEIIRQVSERLPVQTLPDWMRSDVQPIAVVDIIETLVGALHVQTASRSYDVGGPDTLPYPQLLDTYADVAGLTRPQITIPLLPTDLVGTLLGTLTDVLGPVVAALVEFLHHDMVTPEDDFLSDLLGGYNLVGLKESTTRALADEPSDPSTSDPMAPQPYDPKWAQGGDARPVVAKVVDAAKSVLLSGA